MRQFSLYICVNQPDNWWQGTPLEQRICIANRNTIEILQAVRDIDLHIIDRSSPGNGWTGKKCGVGWARKEALELIVQHREPDELIVSLDADTSFGEDYLERVLDTMNAHPESNALAVPYYHPLSGWEEADRCMLRYECYMRHYLANLLEISSPYAFSALGSAMVFPLWAYRRVGGITPLQGGEDFYLMQKFAKTGTIELHTDAMVYPQGRISHRVPFGTGPAVAAGIAQQQARYPFFNAEGFRAIAHTYEVLPTLYDIEADTPMTNFLCHQLKCDDPWAPLRKNYKSRQQFVHAAHERIDGLRILQFLRQFPSGDEHLAKFLDDHGLPHGEAIDFASDPIDELDQTRQSLFQLEQQLRIANDR